MSRAQIFSAQEIESLRKGGKILRDCLAMVAAVTCPGMTTKQIDLLAETFIRDHGGEPGFKGYHGFTGTLCISVNEECVHGIPGPRVLQEGDIVSLDGGVLLDGLNTDACVTVALGPVPANAQHLLKVTSEALDRGVSAVRAGGKVGDISAAVQEHVEGNGCFILHALTGHGLGKTLHQFPDVPNHGKAGTGPTLPLHTIIAIEPIVSLGCEEIRETADGWTIVTKDGSLSAHFEHTVLVTEGGCEILA